MYPKSKGPPFNYFQRLSGHLPNYPSRCRNGLQKWAVPDLDQCFLELAIWSTERARSKLRKHTQKWAPKGSGATSGPMCLGIQHLEYWAGTFQATQADPEMDSKRERCQIWTNVTWNWPSGVSSGHFPSYLTNSKRILAEHEIFEKNQRGNPLIPGTYVIEIIEIQ